MGNQRYPEALFEQTILRVRATQDNEERRTRKVTRGRAAIIKAYLIKNCNRSEEEVTVGLNEERSDAPYVLGRLFSVLESIQEAASPGLNSTIKNKRLSLEEQGDFILGYYHQNQKRFEKRDAESDQIQEA